MSARILVIDDEKLIRWSLNERLTREGYEVVEAATGAEAEVIIDDAGFDLALVDLRLPDTDGLTLCRRINRVQPKVPVLIVTAYSTVANAVEAMRLGAYDYVTKPFNMDEMVILVNRALETRRMREQLSAQVGRQKAEFSVDRLVGDSPSFRELKALVRRVAASKATTVLLRGESGTGKDMLAKALHYESERAEKPFMNITCTAISDTLLESELFGHEKGAFTDAKSRKRGLFDLANGGTVFLDEIGDMSPKLQAKLLRFLDDKTFRRVGGNEDISSDVRIVAATNRDLESAVNEDTFRGDLYYRLNVIPMFVPPLRDRDGDVILLAKYFLQVYNAEFHRQVHSLSDEASKRMTAYHWPGNIRELRNVMERAVLLCAADVVHDSDILLGPMSPSAAPGDGEFTVVLPATGCALRQVERDLLVQALTRTGGNRTRAGDLLGLTRDQIRYKVDKFGLRDVAEPQS